MSWIDAYLPDGSSAQYEQSMRQAEEYDAAVRAEVEYLWDTAQDKLIATDLVFHAEFGRDVGADVLTLIAYARTKAGQTDCEYILDRLIALYEPDFMRAAKSKVDREF